MREFIPFDPASQPTLRPVVAVKESKKRIDISIAFGGFFRSKRTMLVAGEMKDFDVVDIPGTGQLIRSGKPLLPSFGRYLQIPAGCAYKVRITTTVRAVEIADILPVPAQAKLTDGKARHETEYDTALYDSDALYPEDLVSVTGPVLIDGYAALLLHVRPLQYNPSKRTLLAHPRIDISVELAESSAAALGYATDSKESREAFGNLVLNPRRDVAERVGVLYGPHRPPRNGPELIIFHTAEFSDAARRLAHWKKRRGLLTETSLVQPGTTAASLQATIRGLRSAPGARLRYILLLGDVEDIPTESWGHATDYYYATNAPRDSTADTARPPLPWLSLGRIPVRDATEALKVVEKIVAFEKSPPADADYYRRIVCAAYFQTDPVAADGKETAGYVMTMEDIRAGLGPSYEVERVYTSDCPSPIQYLDGEDVPSDVVSSIMTDAEASARLIEAAGQGQLLICHRDHATEDGWMHPRFELLELDQVTGNAPSLFLSINCSSGAWQMEDVTPDGLARECFAERLLRMPGGAPSLIAASADSDPFVNNALLTSIFDALWGGVLAGYPETTASFPVRFNRFGDALNYARAYLLTRDEEPAKIRDHFEIYHLLGDPTLNVWVTAPQPLSISARQIDDRVAVRLSAPAPDTVVTIWNERRMLARVEPTGDRFVIGIPRELLLAAGGRKITFCAWAPGFRFAETTITIAVGSPVRLSVSNPER